ncbi:MAG: SMP-30/gluconolactonase/LRE family protein [Alphaproteobacteria bacterium]
MGEVTCVLDARAVLGEGPVWCPREQALYWVDIKKPAIHRFVPASGAAETWPMSVEVGALALREQGGAVVALRTGFGFFDFATGEVGMLYDPEPHLHETRMNDGKCDRQGRFWAGSYHEVADPRPLGALYRLDPDLSCHRMQGGVICSNGLGWSPDDRTMYLSDSELGRIYAFDFEPSRGAIRNRRLFASVPPEAGFPDGLTVDSEGFVWSVHWGGWRVTRYAPDGRVDRVVGLPVQQPTSCVFGGPGLRVLYITSASIELSQEDKARGPLAGGLFAVDVGVNGLPEPRFAG